MKPLAALEIWTACGEIGVSPVARATAEEMRVPRCCSGFRLRASCPKWLRRKADPSTTLGISPGGSDAASPAQLNKTFCYLFTQKGCLFEMIIRTYLS
jgi:hypothetical protein